MAGWLDNYNDYNVSAPEGFQGDGYSNVGRNSSPAWGGQFQMGGVLPGAVGHMYARHGAPSEGKYAKKTLPSAQNGQEMQYYREGLDWKPKTISQDGTKVDYHTGDKVTYGTPEYKEAYDRGEVVTDQGEYSPIALDEVVIQNNYKRPRGFWEQYRDKIVDENKDSGVLGAIIGTPISAITSLPQLAATYAMTDKVQRPSEAMDIQNPYGAMVTDAVLDPANLVGAGVLTKEKALARLAASKESGLLSNAYKYNPWAFKSNPEAYYRTIGKEGIDDAFNSGVIRPKQTSNIYSPEAGKRIDVNAPAFPEGSYFNKSGLYSTNDLYNPDYIAEVVGKDELFTYPKKTVFNENIRVAPNNIPIEEANFYKKDWLQGYKPIEIPKTTQNFKLGINTMEELPPLPEDFLTKIKKLQESSKSIDMLKQDLADPETIRRAEALGVDPEIFAEASKNMTYSSNRDVPSSYSSSGLEININPNQTGRTPEEAIMSGVMDSHSPNFTANEIGAHELGHFFQDTNYWKNPYPKTISGFDRVMAHAKDLDGKPLSNILDYHSKYSTRDTAPTKVDEMLKDLEIRTGLDKEYYPQKNKNYFVDANKQYGTDVDNMIEKFPMFREYRQGMRDSGILKNKWDEITPEHIEDFRKLKPENRLNSFMQFNDKNYKLLNEVSKIAPAVLPIGLGAASQLEQKREGGIIKDDRGQWDHPGEITEIGSNEITMQGVPYNVLGVSDTGDVKLMKPGKDYKFKGKKVTEYPMAKNGVNQQDQKTLQHIDQLTNFTNYNTKQSGGWLDQY